MTDDVQPLPLAGVVPERADAAANRLRILAAARRLISERGAEHTSMDDIAAAAGVGKGTLFRRFDSRAGLTQALLDESMRAFQDAFLTGPPPLGPGAPPAARLEAFVDELIGLLDEQLDVMLAADFAARGGDQPSPFGTLTLHVRTLVSELNPALDADTVADLLLGALAAGVVHRLKRDRGVDLATVRASARALLRGLT
ncbi:TetR/AcrR family transcriptional regulator [Conexibacter sp. CPCC 206217]|uniref:TetR/AcrR family transcriptional regulator n=1 Tax=Conexibacter sp. CPCC 206217 TaxID=3064574 RepID=UPI0027223F8D|nr:TetR/AcrR family transcriptional regulator [Conexibacter sp. CPCC 206217]MDO8212383.1 helix-turn-helix domain-containing protein [Conexibacter sp. CPCC 206217]